MVFVKVIGDTIRAKELLKTSDPIFKGRVVCLENGQGTALAKQHPDVFKLMQTGDNFKAGQNKMLVATTKTK